MQTEIVKLIEDGSDILINSADFNPEKHMRAEVVKKAEEAEKVEEEKPAKPAKPRAKKDE
jgi:hypothetical protein